MAWEWSHTVDAYETARTAVEQLPKKDLLVILREWAYHDRETAGRLRFRDGQQVWTDTRGRTRVRMSRC